MSDGIVRYEPGAPINPPDEENVRCVKCNGIDNNQTFQCKKCEDTYCWYCSDPGLEEVDDKDGLYCTDCLEDGV